MNSKWNTFAKFTKDLLTVGAIGNTSQKAVFFACEHITNEPNQCYVEFGIGNGNITKFVLQKIHPTSKLYAFEVKKEFCEAIEKEIQDERLTVINDGAQFISKYINTPVNGIISTIPFSFFPKELKHQILQESVASLEVGGGMGQILYSRAHVSLFRKYFPICKIKTVVHFPIEFIYLSEKE